MNTPKLIAVALALIVLTSCTPASTPVSPSSPPVIVLTTKPISTNTPTVTATPSPSPTDSNIVDDQLARIWDIECMDKGCLMYLDIGYGDPSNPDYLTITVAINRDQKDTAFISFIIPDQVDKEKGLAVSFADSEKNTAGEWTINIAKSTTRIIDFEGCKSGDCTARAIGGIIPASSEHGELNLIDQFLTYRLVLFMYWYNGEPIRASATLSGFQSQYPNVINEQLK